MKQEASLKTLQDIRSIMERSARFISLSGWSGVWAGSMALAGCLVAYDRLKQLPVMGEENYAAAISPFVSLAIAVFFVALVGAYYFTWRKTRQAGGKIWNSASRKMLLYMAIPMAAGGLFALHFLYAAQAEYVAPMCLAFYGLALINASKYTLSDIQYLGICDVALGCIALFMPGMGLILWAIGFGGLHILYGIVMWNKYDKHSGKTGTGQ